MLSTLQTEQFVIIVCWTAVENARQTAFWPMSRAFTMEFLELIDGKDSRKFGQLTLVGCSVPRVWLITVETQPFQKMGKGVCNRKVFHYSPFQVIDNTIKYPRKKLNNSVHKKTQVGDILMIFRTDEIKVRSKLVYRYSGRILR